MRQTHVVTSTAKGVDDAAYLAGVITEIQASFDVDPKRIDVIGHSNGGFMSYALSCAHADKIAAMVSLAGATFLNPTDCAPTGPVAVLEVHGTADDTILYEGGTVDLGPGQSMAPYPGAEASVATWAKYDGCATSSVVDEHVDVDAHVSVNGSARRIHGDPMVGLSTGRGRRTLDDPGWRSRPGHLGRVPRPPSWTSSRPTRSHRARSRLAVLHYGASSAGFWSKNPSGWSEKPTVSRVMTG